MTTEHPDYSILAARIAVSNLHKMTKKSFSEVMTDCYTYVDAASGRASKMIADDVYEIIKEVRDQPPPPDSLPPDLGAPSATRLRRFEPQARSRFPRAR